METKELFYDMSGGADALRRARGELCDHVASLVAPDRELERPSCSTRSRRSEPHNPQRARKTAGAGCLRASARRKKKQSNEKRVFLKHVHVTINSGVIFCFLAVFQRFVIMCAYMCSCDV